MKLPFLISLLAITSAVYSQTRDNFLSVSLMSQTTHTALNVSCQMKSHIMNEASALQEYTEDLIQDLAVDEFVYLDVFYDYSSQIDNPERDRIGFLPLHQTPAFMQDLKYDGVEDSEDTSQVLYIRISAENLDVTQALATIEYALTHKLEVMDHQTITYGFVRMNPRTDISINVQCQIVDEVYNSLLLNTPITERSLEIASHLKRVSIDPGNPSPDTPAFKGYFENNNTYIYKMNENDSSLVGQYSSIYEIHSSRNGRLAVFKDRNSVDVFDDQGSVYSCTLPHLFTDNYRCFYVLDNADGNVDISYFPVRDCSPIESFSKDNLVVVEYSNTDQSFRLKQDWKDCE